MKELLALHKSPKFELKHLHVLLHNDCHPQKTLPQSLSKRVQKTLNNASPVVLEE